MQVNRQEISAQMKTGNRKEADYVYKKSFFYQKKILAVNDDEKKYLMQLGYNPVSKDNDKWIFFSNKDILSLLKKYRNGGENQTWEN